MIPEQTEIINIPSISPLPSPSPLTPSQYYETEWTLWDRFVVDGRRDGSEMTVQELYDYFEVCDRLPCVCVCVRVCLAWVGIFTLRYSFAVCVRMQMVHKACEGLAGVLYCQFILSVQFV